MTGIRKTKFNLTACRVCTKELYNEIAFNAFAPAPPDDVALTEALVQDRCKCQMIIWNRLVCALK